MAPAIVSGSLVVLLLALGAPVSGLAQEQPRRVRIGALQDAPPQDVSRPLDDRSLTAPAAWWWYTSVTSDFITRVVQERNARIVDIEVDPAAPDRFAVVLVENSGPYARRWWWYPRASGPQVDAYRAEHRARVADIELVRLRPDATFAVVLVEDRGPGSDWTAGSVDASDLEEYAIGLFSSGKRLTDLDPNPRFRGYMTTASIEDPTGDTWWVYLNVTPGIVASKLEANRARPVDIEWSGGNSFGVIMVPAHGEAWWWFYDKSLSELNQLTRETGARIIDIEPVQTRDGPRFAAILLQNR